MKISLSTIVNVLESRVFVKVVISGSFRKHIDGILELKKQLEEYGIEVLKPDGIEVIDETINSTFVKFKGEEDKLPRGLEMEYLDAIRNCDAHIIFNKDSYFGNTTIFELGYGKGINCVTYLLEEPFLDSIICNNDTIEFYYLIKSMIYEGKIRVGIENLYEDFNIKSKQYSL